MKVEIPDNLLADLEQAEDVIATHIKAPLSTESVEILGKAISRRDTLAIVIAEYARQTYADKTKAG